MFLVCSAGISFWLAFIACRPFCSCLSPLYGLNFDTFLATARPRFSMGLLSSLSLSWFLFHSKQFLLSVGSFTRREPWQVSVRGSEGLDCSPPPPTSQQHALVFTSYWKHSPRLAHLWAQSGHCAPTEYLLALFSDPSDTLFNMWVLWLWFVPVWGLWRHAIT